MNLSNFYLEASEFAPPGKYKDLRCKGRHCDNCGKCRDWYYTGDLKTWQWIQNLSNWQQHDWQRYRNDEIYERFKKRAGATCSDPDHFDYDVVYSRDPRVSVYSDVVTYVGFVSCVCEDNCQN